MGLTASESVPYLIQLTLGKRPRAALIDLVKRSGTVVAWVLCVCRRDRELKPGFTGGRDGCFGAIIKAALKGAEYLEEVTVILSSQAGTSCPECEFHPKCGSCACQTAGA